MNETIKKKGNKEIPDSTKEKLQYTITIGVISTILVAIGFPFIIVFLFGIFAFLIWKVPSLSASKEIREVFDFYIKANEILRDDERRWFGFEIKETINQGEEILEMFPDPPPLLYFTLGALYYKLGDYKAAAQKLSKVAVQQPELLYTTPSRELQTYVRILRKIENDPAEAPQTSAAIRALERARRNRASNLLAESLSKIEAEKKEIQEEPNLENFQVQEATLPSTKTFHSYLTEGSNSKKEETEPNERKPISEVLHDIYD